MFAFFKLPVSPLPQVDFPTISVQAIAARRQPGYGGDQRRQPLERHLGQIADVTEMTSTSSVGQARIVLQFGLDRDINGAARDVQAAINAARADLPTSLRSNPTYRKVNPADAPILILALTSKTLTRGQMYDAATNVLSQRLSQIDGIGQVIIGGAALPAVRVELNPHRAVQIRHRPGGRARRACLRQCQQPERLDRGRRAALPALHQRSGIPCGGLRPLVVGYRNGAAVRLSDVADVQDSVENIAMPAWPTASPRCW